GRSRRPRLETAPGCAGSWSAVARPRSPGPPRPCARCPWAAGPWGAQRLRHRRGWWSRPSSPGTDPESEHDTGADPDGTGHQALGHRADLSDGLATGVDGLVRDVLDVVD